MSDSQSLEYPPSTQKQLTWQKVKGGHKAHREKNPKFPIFCIVLSDLLAKLAKVSKGQMAYDG